MSACNKVESSIRGEISKCMGPIGNSMLSPSIAVTCLEKKKKGTVFVQRSLRVPAGSAEFCVDIGSWSGVRRCPKDEFLAMFLLRRLSMTESALSVCTSVDYSIKPSEVHGDIYATQRRKQFCFSVAAVNVR